MMGSDARDVMGLPSAGPPKPTPAKVQKPKVRGPTGISREVLDLNYEGAPPISIIAPKFKDKPKLPFKPRPWEQTPFGNSARKDGLILRHWKRKGDVGAVGATMPVTPAESNAASEMDQDDKPTTTVPDAVWSKYNVKIERPQYTNQEYDTHLKNEDWDKEETDYLVDLAYEFDLRWMVISDRYEYQPKEIPKENEDTMAVTMQAKPRTQEDMKARYYDVAAKTMVLRNPLSSMSSSEFDAHEKMTKYDPVQETRRKRYAEQLMNRTKEEKDEEELLLKELSRIVANQEKLSADRKALYDRLEAAQSLSRDSYSTTLYQSSQGLAQLVSNLVSQTKNKELEKKEKRRSAIEAGDLPQSAMDRDQRRSIGGSDKRGSTSNDPSRRQLSAREEAKYGVSHPNERLTGGVQFRHERVTKAGQAKSGVQTSRIGAALTELKIPPRLHMPTTKVVTEYERLIESIKVLLDARKLTEKLDGEIKVWKAQKEQAEAKERGEEVKQEIPNSSADPIDEEGNESEDSKMDGVERAERPKVEEQEDNDEEEDGDKDAEGEKEDSDDDPNPDDEASNNDDDDDDDDEDADAEGEAEDSALAEEMRDLQEDEEGEEAEQEQTRDLDGGDAEDEDTYANGEEEEDEEEDVVNDAERDNDIADAIDGGDNEDEEEGEGDEANSPTAVASPAPTSKSGTAATMRKRSASVVSHVSNRSSKRQRK